MKMMCNVYNVDVNLTTKHDDNDDRVLDADSPTSIINNNKALKPIPQGILPKPFLKQP